MTRGIESLEAAIAAHLAEWDEPFVELVIHGTAAPDSIAHAIDAFCRRELGSRVEATLFYRSSVGAVTGVELADRRRVVIKARQPDQHPGHARDVVKLQNHLAASERIAPSTLAGPSALGAGSATAEEYCVRGATRDGHLPSVRRALASGLHRVMHACDRFVDVVSLRSTELPADSLWPTPHSRLFDLAATTLGAGYIDDLAREARRRMEPVGRRVITHNDWRAEHVRFDGDAISVAYDWDSLRVSCEPAAVGSTAHMFCADWSREDFRQAPALDEARAFIADYEATRGHPFTRAERRACGSAFAFAVAYTARCGHAAGVDIRYQPGNHQHLIAAHGVGLLDL